MARKNNLKAVKESLGVYFQGRHEKAYPERSLRLIFEENSNSWNIYKYISAKNFLAFIVNEGILLKKEFRDSDGAIRLVYHLPEVDDFTIYNGLRKGGYFTHYTSMYLHGLTLQIPKTHYLNFEHYSVEQKAELTQEAIDNAFDKPQRKSKKNYSLGGNKITLLQGMFTNKLGVIEQYNDTQAFFFTNIERTLIDIAIRPVYSGGVFEVLNAYREAKEKVNIHLLKEYLENLNFTYPYHQVIGFYLEKAGYPESTLSLFEDKIEFNFYLTYDIRKRIFSNRWKLYYPQGI